LCDFARIAFVFTGSLEGTGTTTLSGEELEKRMRNELKIGNLHQFMWFYRNRLCWLLMASDCQIGL
jgi:hypothetical protein